MKLNNEQLLYFTPRLRMVHMQVNNGEPTVKWAMLTRLMPNWQDHWGMYIRSEWVVPEHQRVSVDTHINKHVHINVSLVLMTSYIGDIISMQTFTAQLLILPD